MAGAGAAKEEQEFPPVDETAMTLEQLQLSASELISYVGRLDRLERMMVSRAVKAGNRLVLATRRADAVVEALAHRQELLAGICDALLPVLADKLAGDQQVSGIRQADPMTDMADQIGALALRLLAMAEQVEACADRIEPASRPALEQLLGSVVRLKTGMECMETALGRAI
jgi:hypothetical protein